MSLNSINLIIETLILNASKLESINHCCVIYIRQIMGYFRRYGMKEFIGKKEYFKGVFDKLEYNEEEFKNGQHYILLQDIYTEEDDIIRSYNSFQPHIEGLLKEIHLSSYRKYNKTVKPLEDLIEVTKQVMKYPEKFAISSENTVNTQILANKLLEVIIEHKITDTDLNNLITYYAEQITYLNQQKKIVLSTLGILIKNIKTRMMYLKDRKKYLKNYIVPKLIVKMIIEDQKIPFELYTNTSMETIPNKDSIPK